MTEWYYADGQDRQGPLLVEDLRQRFQRGEISLTTLVWREGYPQWKPVSEAVEELQLQNLTSATSNLGSGFDLRGRCGDVTVVDVVLDRVVEERCILRYYTDRLP